MVYVELGLGGDGVVGKVYKVIQKPYNILLDQIVYAVCLKAFTLKHKLEHHPLILSRSGIIGH